VAGETEAESSSSIAVVIMVEVFAVVFA